MVCERPAHYRDLSRIDGTPNPIFDRWLDHPDYDAYWRSLIPYGEAFAKVDIPVFVQTRILRRRHGRGALLSGAALSLPPFGGPSPAGWPLSIIPQCKRAFFLTVRGYEVDRAARIDLQDIRLKWFDHVFHGAPMPEILRDRINFQVTGL
ncbi:hypothetical protein ACRAWD_02550 [Caulobacter segnis]